MGKMDGEIDKKLSISPSFLYRKQNSMKNNFKVKIIKEGLYQIVEPYFSEHANLYLIKGADFDLLVDAGLGLDDIKHYLINCGLTNNLKVIATHSHFDHIGGLRHFLPKDILITNKVLQNLHHKKLWGLTHLKPKYFSPTIRREVSQKILWPVSFKLTDIQPLFLKSVNLGNRCFEILEMPGHTNDSIILYDKINKLIVTGDVLYDGGIYCHFINSDKKQFKKTLQFLSKLDFNLVLPGHNCLMSKKRALNVIKRWINHLSV